MIQEKEKASKDVRNKFLLDPKSGLKWKIQSRIPELKFPRAWQTRYTAGRGEALSRGEYCL